ncbi:MAG: class I SAM-dependent methyltransferase [Chloroflexota bacterium]|nr:class I SAM-dependent methyltransferase [Chloroflexota bacterium]MDE2687085.1 class I SAM-dependent methyltransferase [Chloroflexota bacterium]
MNSENKVQWVYASKNNQQLQERYDEWAEEYDGDLTDDFGYVMPRMAAEIFERFVPKDRKVLDAGAGTGLVGVELNRLGYADIEAMDMSSGMLEQASAKGVYGAVHRMVMGETLGFDTDTFDAAIGVGVLTLGHAPASSLDELVRVTKPGGCVAFTLRPDIYEENGFRAKQEQLVSDGKWELVEATDAFYGMPKGEPDVQFQVWIYRVTA